MLRHSPLAKLALLFLLSLGYASCDMTDANQSMPLKRSESSPPISIIPNISDGRLFFEDMNEFDKFMIQVGNQERSYLDEYEKSINFLSLKRHLNNIEDTTGVYEEIVEDPFFATSLNVNGEIQIGEYVYKITRDYVYKVEKIKDHLLDSIDIFYTGKIINNNSKHYEIIPIERSIKEVAFKTDDTLAITTCSQPLGRHDNKDYRLKGKVWITHFVWYSSAGILIESQRERRSWKRWLSRWHRVEAASISVTASYDLYTVKRVEDTINGIDVKVEKIIHRTNDDYYYLSKSNAKEIESRVYHQTSNGTIRGKISGIHYASRNNTNKSGKCETSVSK